MLRAMKKQFLRWKRTLRKFYFGGVSNDLLSTYAPLAVVLRLNAVFYLKRAKEGNPRILLNFSSLSNLLGWSLLGYSLVQIFNSCSLLSLDCTFAVLLSISFLPVVLLTESELKNFFNAIEELDTAIRGFNIHRVINPRSRSVRLLMLMVTHLAAILYIMSFGGTLRNLHFGLAFSHVYIAVQRRFMFVAYLWLCEEIGQRFLLLENCWLRSAHAQKMEKVRLLHEKISATAHLLDNAFGPRLILLMVDTYFQCTGFFIHTALFPSGRRFHSVLSYFALHIYCFLSSMTATDNVGIKSRSLLKVLQKMSFCKLPEEERVQWLDGLVTVWMLIVQTAPDMNQVFLKYYKQ